MNNYKHTRFTLVLGFLLAGLAVAFVAHAEPEVRLQIQHQILQPEQTAGMENGQQMLVEIINQGNEVINEAALNLEGSRDIQILPAHLQLGRLEPSQVKAVNIAFQRMDTADANASKNFVWRIDYQDSKGIPHQTMVIDNSRNEQPLITK